MTTCQRQLSRHESTIALPDVDDNNIQAMADLGKTTRDSDIQSTGSVRIPLGDVLS